MKVDDSLLGLFFAGLGALMIVHATDMRALDHIPYGPGFFPTIVGAAMVGFGGLMVLRRLAAGTGRVSGIVRLERDRTRPDWWVAPLLFVAAPVFYVLAADALGFLIVMPLILVVLIGYLGGRWMSAAVLAVVISLVLHGLFAHVMRVPLPWGLLEPWAGILS